MRSRLPRAALLTAAVPLALTTLLAGCTSAKKPAATGSPAASASEQESGASAEQLGTVQSVDCPGTAKAVALPETGVPAPLPEDVVVVDVRGPVDGRTVVTGVVARAEHDVLSELQDVYPSAGFTLSNGETEAHDAESNFAGNGVKGRWGIRELGECSPVATRIDLVFTAVR